MKERGYHTRVACHHTHREAIEKCMSNYDLDQCIDVPHLDELFINYLNI